jgi:hypothetical protein
MQETTTFYGRQGWAADPSQQPPPPLLQLTLVWRQ